jgi:hypothetical protein
VEQLISVSPEKLLPSNGGYRPRFVNGYANEGQGNNDGRGGGDGGFDEGSAKGNEDIDFDLNSIRGHPQSTFMKQGGKPDGGAGDDNGGAGSPDGIANANGRSGQPNRGRGANKANKDNFRFGMPDQNQRAGGDGQGNGINPNFLNPYKN